MHFNPSSALMTVSELETFNQDSLVECQIGEDFAIAYEDPITATCPQLCLTPVRVSSSAFPIPTIFKQQSTKRALEEAFGELHSAARKRTTESMVMQKDRYLDAHRLLDLIGTHCGVCLLKNIQGNTTHIMKDCPAFQTSQHAQLASIRRSVDLKKMENHVCYHCLLPSGSHNELHPEFIRGTITCTHPNLAWPIAALIWYTPELRIQAAGAFAVPGGVWSDIGSYMDWYFRDDIEYFSRSLHLSIWLAKSQGLL